MMEIKDREIIEEIEKIEETLKRITSQLDDVKTENYMVNKNLERMLKELREVKLELELLKKGTYLFLLLIVIMLAFQNIFLINIFIKLLNK